MRRGIRWLLQQHRTVPNTKIPTVPVRDHLGVETQRQWSDKAITRTTPCLLGLFSIVTLLASRLDDRARIAVSTST
ncbi:hypothetical protein DOO78_25715 [Roseicella frigidaeris]|uniref:Uncharacterized protein n=1 Tax=Roseicella frigidaeris TaxID=2230885 RepID=A0A327LWQ7_9PROT|nr:hypothetical protein DOO78_25715 [Roseicella frigidaeris]